MKKNLANSIAFATATLLLVLAVGYGKNHQTTSLTPSDIPEASNAQNTNNDKANVQQADNNEQIITLGPEISQTSDYKNRIGKTVTAPSGEQIVLKRYYINELSTDPYASQWWQSSTGVSDLWAMSPPTHQTLIAIIDTGFALGHEEFNGRLFNNSGELGLAISELASKKNCTDLGVALDARCNNIDDNADGIVDNESGSTNYQNPSLLNCTDSHEPLDKSCNRIDDDNNGYIDDVSGWDFVNQDPSAQAGQLNPSGTGIKHGSMVMGIAAANGNNNVGLAGVNNYAKLLPLQAIDDDSYGDSLTVGNAIKYAANMGADVINLSLGTATPDPYMLDAIEYAYSKGSVIVAAAGNDGCDCMVYPAKYDITISVGASNQNGARASFSSFGNSLDLVAPGSGITSASYSNSNKNSLYSSGSGTSYAAPIVSGLAAGIKSYLPTANQTQIQAMITESTAQNAQGSYFKSMDKGYGDIAINKVASRIKNSKKLDQIYVYGDVFDGGVFKYSNNNTTAYNCATGAVGTTPIYRAIKNNSFITMNAVDNRFAQINGYSINSFINACILQPHDIVMSKRIINTNLEFFGTPPKGALVPN